MSVNLDQNSSQQTNSSVGNVSESIDGSTENKKKRAIFAIGNSKNYYDERENPDGFVPASNELCVDENGVIYVWAEDESGKKVKLSAMKQLIDTFTNMKQLGIIQNAEAFRLNGKIYNFIFNNDKMTLTLNPELDLFEDYRYYSIRKINRDPITNEYVYITGIQHSETSQIIETKGKIYHNGERYVPAPARMIATCEEGEKYLVEFFDSDRNLIGTQIYYAKSGKVFDFALSPDKAIEDLVVLTDRPGTEADTCFLYQNEDPTNLVIRVGLKYVDGTTRDITEEGKTTGRLIFEGRDSLTTNEISLDLNSAQEIKISYFMDIDNSVEGAGYSVDPDDPSSMEQLYLDPNTAVLSKTIKVLVKENIYDPVIDVTLQGYKDVQTDGDLTDLFKIKVFAKYESGNLRDITPVMDSERFVSSAGFEYNSNSKCLESTKVLASFTAKVIIPQGRGTVMFTKTFACEFTEYNKRMNINRVEGGFDSQDATKFTLFNSSQNKMKISEIDTLATIRDKYCYKYNLPPEEYIVPNYVLVRNALDVNVIYTGVDLADSFAKLDDPNGIISYRIPDDNLIFDDMPLVVEFYKIDINEETGARENIFLTHMQRTYAKSTSTVL